MRIVSLLPSGTEIVDALGLADNLVAITHACSYPNMRDKPRITRDAFSHPTPHQRELAGRYWDAAEPMFTIDRDMLRALRPSIILTQPLNGYGAVPYQELRDAVASLPPPQPKVVDVQPASVEDILYSIRTVGTATGSQTKADYLCDALWTRVEYVRNTAAEQRRSRPRTVIIEWTSPLYCGGHWQPELIRLAGGRSIGVDAFGESASSDGLDEHEVVSWHQIREFAPEVIVVAPCNCGLDQGRRDMSALEELPGYWNLPAVKHGRVYLADGRSFFRAGPRIIDTLELLAFVMNPELFAEFCPRPEDAIAWI